MFSWFLNYWHKNPGKLATYFTIFVTFLLVIPSPPEPQIQSEYIKLDKPIHFALFSIHFFLVSKAFEKVPLRNLKSLFLTLLFAGITELLQHYIPYRTSEFYDVVADISGAFFVFFLQTFSNLITNPKKKAPSSQS